MVGLFAQWDLKKFKLCINGAIYALFIGYRVVSTIFGQISMFHYYYSLYWFVVVK